MVRRLVFLLHAHLPDCRRPAHPASLEETWFFEALTESYLPLVGTLDRLRRDRIRFQLTVCLSPVLIGMLQDTALLDRFRDRLRRTIALAERDTSGPWKEQAQWHATFFAAMLKRFEVDCRRDLLAVLRDYQKSGHLELATTAATHAFLPIHQHQPATLRAQVGIALDVFRAAFGTLPTFFWLPECAYFPGLEVFLAEQGITSFALESHGALKAHPPAPSLRRPVVCPNQVRAIGRDPELSRLVWSAQAGYPGHPHYREFHRDRSGDLKAGEIHQWLGGPFDRLPSGLKYWRVTGQKEEKALYEPAVAAHCAAAHARDFVDRLARAPESDGIWFVPFDAELFGHWWFEGPIWLEQVYREIAKRGPTLTTATVSAAVTAAPAPFPTQPAASSWGAAGDFSHWISEENAWILPRLFDGAERLQRLIDRCGNASPDTVTQRILQQAARTLLLAQGSDWPFLLQTGTARELGQDWVEGLLERFENLCEQLEAGHCELDYLAQCEATDAAFPHLNLDYFSTAP